MWRPFLYVLLLSSATLKGMIYIPQSSRAGPKVQDNFLRHLYFPFSFEFNTIYYFASNVMTPEGNLGRVD